MGRVLKILTAHLARVVANFGLLAYVLGTIAAIVAKNPGAFQRFGAIGTAAAVLFFTDRLAQIELRRQKTVERILHEFGLELEVLKEGVEPKELPNEGYVTDYLAEEAQFDHLRGHAERINSRNIFLLTIATLQWGFGDEFLNWLL